MKYFNTTCPRPSIDLTEIQALRLGLRQGGGCTEKLKTPVVVVDVLS